MRKSQSKFYLRKLAAKMNFSKLKMIEKYMMIEF